MSNPIPKWVMQRYSVIWNEFKDKEFGYSEALKVLREKNKNLVSVVFSQLKKNGWLTIKIHPKDSRKRIYKLISPQRVISEMPRERD